MHACTCPKCAYVRVHARVGVRTRVRMCVGVHMSAFPFVHTCACVHDLPGVGSRQHGPRFLRWAVLCPAPRLLLSATHADRESAPRRLRGGVRPQLIRRLLLVPRDPQHLHLHQRLGLCAVVDPTLPDLCLELPLPVRHPRHRDDRQGALAAGARGGAPGPAAAPPAPRGAARVGGACAARSVAPRTGRRPRPQGAHTRA